MKHGVGSTIKDTNAQREVRQVHGAGEKLEAGGAIGRRLKGNETHERINLVSIVL